LFEKAFKEEVNDSSNFTFSHQQLPWPLEPFGPVGNVIEASGTEAQLLEVLKDHQYVLSHKSPFTEKVFKAAPNLKFIGICRGGPVNVDLEAATKAGVVVTYAPGRNAQAAAEFTIALILSSLRKISDADKEMKAGVWRGDYFVYEKAGQELNGTTVGVIGFGAVGKIVAKILNAFGANILVHDPFADPKEIEKLNCKAVELNELMSQSFVVTLHSRLTEKTKHLINADNLKLMPKGALLVNTARGGLLDYSSLPALLESGQLGGLALDVYDEEPPSQNYPLLKSQNVVLTPHLGGATKQTGAVAAKIVAADLNRFLKGEKMMFVANPQVLSKS
jgi:D-3-phosphoglycerate dehydrogenase